MKQVDSKPYIQLYFYLCKGNHAKRRSDLPNESPYIKIKFKVRHYLTLKMT